jgi:hypothetical protein
MLVIGVSIVFWYQIVLNFELFVHFNVKLNAEIDIFKYIFNFYNIID